jgi:hypothetical protein
MIIVNNNKIRNSQMPTTFTELTLLAVTALAERKLEFR